MQMVEGGHTAIIINGVIGPLFANGIGLHQGDPVSPLLFHFVADALSHILNFTATVGHIKGVVRRLCPEGISHLQYADDTIILVENNDLQLAKLKFLLLCFEAMSGLKINDNKSEVLVVGCPPMEQKRIANFLNCGLGSFPIKYLGIPLSPFKLKASDFIPIEQKISTRVAPWRGKYNTLGEKVILINACLSCLPMYNMGFYHLSESNHSGFDKHRSAFYWNKADDKKKYRLVQWKHMCKPKCLGGLGIINTSIMNKWLIMKWWWKIYNDPPRSLWGELFKAKYYPHCDPLNANPRDPLTSPSRPLFLIALSQRSLLGSSLLITGTSTFAVHCPL